MSADLRKLIDRLTPPAAPSSLAVTFKTASRLTTLSQSTLQRLAAASYALEKLEIGASSPFQKLRNLVA